MKPFYSAIRYGKASPHYTLGKELPEDIEIEKKERIVPLLLGETKVHDC